MCNTNRKLYSDQARAGFLSADENKTFHKIRRSLQQDIFNRTIVDRNARILDIGCGAASFIGMLVKDGFFRVYGIEPDKKLVDFALQRYPELRGQVLCGSATELPFSTKTFDCVYFFNVMHHLIRPDDYIEALKQAKYVLKPSASLIMIEPCRKLLYRLKRGLLHILSPVSPFCRHVHSMMAAEKVIMEQFIDHRRGIARYANQMGFLTQYNRMHFHQWVFVARRN